MARSAARKKKNQGSKTADARPYPYRQGTGENCRELRQLRAHMRFPNLHQARSKSRPGQITLGALSEPSEHGFFCKENAAGISPHAAECGPAAVPDVAAHLGG